MRDHTRPPPTFDGLDEAIRRFDPAQLTWLSSLGDVQMPDFIADARILWSKDRSSVVGEGDKDADPAAVYSGVGGVVHEDEARRLGLIGDGGGLTARGKALGYVAGTPQPERSAAVARGETRPPAPAPPVPAPPVGGDRPSS